MSKNKKITDFEIDGVPVKSITKINTQTKKPEWTLFHPVEKIDFLGCHFINGVPEQNHIDVYSKENTNNEKLRIPNIRPAGTLVIFDDNFKIKETHIIPPVINKDNHGDFLTNLEKGHEYVRRVKLIEKKEKKE